MNLSSIVSDHLHPLEYIKRHGKRVNHSVLEIDVTTLKIYFNKVYVSFALIQQQGHRDLIRINVGSTAKVESVRHYDIARFMMPDELLVNELGMSLFHYMKDTLGLQRGELFRAHSSEPFYAYVNISDNSLKEFVRRLRLKHPYVF